MPNPYANTRNGATIRTATLCSGRKSSAYPSGRASSIFASSGWVALAVAFSTVCLFALGLAAYPDGRGLIVGLLLCALFGRLVRGGP